MLALTSLSYLANASFPNKHMRLQIQIRFWGRVRRTAQLSLPINANFVHKKPTASEAKSYVRCLKVYFVRQRNINANVSGNPSRFFSRRLEKGVLLCHTGCVFCKMDPL